MNYVWSEIRLFILLEFIKIHIPIYSLQESFQTSNLTVHQMETSEIICEHLYTEILYGSGKKKKKDRPTFTDTKAYIIKWKLK